MEPCTTKVFHLRVLVFCLAPAQGECSCLAGTSSVFSLQEDKLGNYQEQTPPFNIYHQCKQGSKFVSKSAYLDKEYMAGQIVFSWFVKGVHKNAGGLTEYNAQLVTNTSSFKTNIPELGGLKLAMLTGNLHYSLMFKTSRGVPFLTCTTQQTSCYRSLHWFITVRSNRHSAI